MGSAKLEIFKASPKTLGYAKLSKMVIIIIQI